jgi:putative membrane protein insertion efficiency factor
MIRSVYSSLVWLVLLPVHVYRAVLSPLKGAPSCRFLPTCSEYAVTAVKQRGIVVGGALAMWRLLRCNPLVPGGYDPVPRSGGRRTCRCQEP